LDGVEQAAQQQRPVVEHHLHAGPLGLLGSPDLNK
jgi:hypothetical protein